MDYHEFKDAFLDALRESGLPILGCHPLVETFDIHTTRRTVRAYVEPIAREIGHPFHVSGAVSWNWDALLTARTTGIEEDVLTELLGRAGARGIDTEQPWIRIDLELRASLEFGRSLPMPAKATWKRWSREAIGRLEAIEPLVASEPTRRTDTGHDTVLAWQGAPEVRLLCEPDGELRLSSLTLAAFQGIDLPRHWDDPEREADGDPREQLRGMFSRLKAALYAWAEVMDHLRG